MKAIESIGGNCKDNMGGKMSSRGYGLYQYHGY
jgi:hypothetical protein